jgi:hypothetical protein
VRDLEAFAERRHRTRLVCRFRAQAVVDGDGGNRRRFACASPGEREREQGGRVRATGHGDEQAFGAGERREQRLQARERQQWSFCISRSTPFLTVTGAAG